MNDSIPSHSRRQFLQASSALGLGAMLMPSRLRAAATTTPRLGRRKFGRSGVDVSMLSLGGIFDTVNNQVVLRQAYQHGVTYWDTAEGYLHGGSETGMGVFFERNPEARKDIFLVSKAGGRRSVDEMSDALDESLARLKTDYVDLYFMHGVNDIAKVDRPEIKAWADAAKKSGKIRLFGFSTHSNMESCLTGAARLGWIDGVMFTYNYRSMHTPQMRAAVEAATEAGIGLTAMKTIGRTSGKDTPEQAAILAALTERGFTPEQAKIKAVWEDSAIAAICSQMPNVNILRQNIAAALDQTALTRGEHEALQQYAAATCHGYCAGCSQHCESVFAGEVPVRDVMRHLMYHRHYGPEHDARAMFAELPPRVRTRLVEVDYSAAERACPHHLPIGQFMREASSALT